MPTQIFAHTFELIVVRLHSPIRALYLDMVVPVGHYSWSFDPLRHEVLTTLVQAYQP